MTHEDEVKLEWMSMFDDLDSDLSFRHFPMLKYFSEDEDPSVRLEAARLIAKFLNGKAKKVLFRLAEDENQFVRDISYVVLRRFIYDDVALFFQEAMQKEQDAHIRGNIIFSWATVVSLLNQNNAEHIDFLLKRKFRENNDECLLNCSYGQYLLGDKCVLTEIVSYLDSREVDIRDTALVYLDIIEDAENRGDIKKAVTRLLKTEENEVVRTRIEGLLDKIDNEEKTELLDTFDQLEDAPDEYLPIFWKLSFDKDDFIRSEVAKYSIEYVNAEGKEILLRLARDKDEMVRTEAYDSLSYFPYDDVEAFLEKAMQTEKDDLARGFAILSWSDVVASLDHVTDDKVDLLRMVKATEKDDTRLLDCCYARYMLTDKESDLNELIHNFQHEDYTIRCCTANLLKEIIYDDNAETIKKAIAHLLKNESSAKVRETAIYALQDFPYDDVALFLKESIFNERDSLKRSYSICSWADVVASLDHDTDENTVFILEQKAKEKADICLLSWCYAQYVLGNDDALVEILSYLQCEDIAIRRTTLDLLRNVVDKENKEAILKALRVLLDVEETVEINDLARDFLEEIQ